MHSMMVPATSLPVALEMPWRPGELLTSRILGPASERRISTPATVRLSARAALMAVWRSSRLSFAVVAVPPWWRLERKSPDAAVRFMAPTTLPCTTKARMSSPAASLTNSWTRKFASRLEKASIMAAATFLVSASTTPLPWVDSSSLRITGAPPTRSMSSLVSRVVEANAVAGMPRRWLAKTWWASSLSRELPMALAELRQYTPIASNWRTTARP